MKFLIFSGTTEGRTLSRELAEAGGEVTVSVATGYGREMQGDLPGIAILRGRMQRADMKAALRGMDLCVDATHPYALIVSQNIRTACEVTGARLIRVRREEIQEVKGAEPFHLCGTEAYQESMMQ